MRRVSQEAIDGFNRNPDRAIQDVAEVTAKYVAVAFAAGVFAGFIAGAVMGKFVL